MPLNVILTLWIWFGRSLVGSPLGWWVLILPISGGPVLLLLIITTVWVRRRRRAAGTLTRPQRWAHACLWSAMFAGGLVLVDGGDAPKSDGSALSAWFGRDVLSLSGSLTQACAIVGLIGWVAILVTVGRDE